MLREVSHSMMCSDWNQRVAFGKGDWRIKSWCSDTSPLDHLLDLTTFGNNSLIQNAVLMLIPRTHLTRIADTTTLAPLHAKGVCPSVPLPAMGHY